MTDSSKRKGLSAYFPILDWGRRYKTSTLFNDALAAVIVTIMLIPQSLAYALLAGLPPQMGLYASILPLVAYAVFGTSRTLAVGPVAVISLMTAAAAGKLASQGSPEYIAVAGLLALISGAMLLGLGLLKAGFIADFLSHPVISGFITASGILIAVSQLKHILGISASGHNLIEILSSLFAGIGQINFITVAIGVPTLMLLFWTRSGLAKLLTRIGLSKTVANITARTGPVIAVITTILVVAFLNLENAGVKIVGDIPRGLPPITLSEFDQALWMSLLSSSLIIAIVGFVETVSVAQTLAAKRRQKIDPDQELIGLGTANIAASLTGGYPVTGGFARSAVNFDAGAETPAAGAYTALGILLATLFLTPLLYFLPIATLAATIIVAVLSLVDIKSIKEAWAYSKSDFAAMIATILVTLLIGVEAGIMSGVAISIALGLFRSSRPHYAIVGQVADSEHYRNVDRHKVITSTKALTIRIDESLYFANAHRMESEIYAHALNLEGLQHVILMCSAVNHIDFSALESLMAINARLKDAGLTLHLSEVKGPVMDRLQKSHFLDDLTGQVFMSQHEAIKAICGNAYGEDLEYTL